MQAEQRAAAAPDFDNLRRALLREGPPGPVPMLELFHDPGLVKAVSGLRTSHRVFTGGSDKLGVDEERAYLDALVRFSLEMGYDVVWAFMPELITEESESWLTAPDAADGERKWLDVHAGAIGSRADLERYAWPTPEQVSYRAVEYLDSVVPEGMKISAVPTGTFEIVTQLMGFEPFSYALADDPELVATICELVGDYTATVLSNVASFENVGIIFMGDDLGFATGTLVSARVLRDHIFPQYRRFIDIVHGAGKPIVLHSCGNLGSIMDELIELGFDAKHSFEDKITPVEEAYRRWGERIAIVGGLDMDVLARGTESEVRQRAREILEVCATSGTGYCFGTGNSAADYIPPSNYLAMLDEGRRWNREHFGTT